MHRPTKRRSLGVAVALLLLVGVLTVASLAVGARPTAPEVVWQALIDPASTVGDHLVVRARIARTVDALVVGAALGLAGGSMQGITRNPLADPGILGVNAGAAAAIVMALAVFNIAGIAPLAIAGALGALGGFVLPPAFGMIGRATGSPQAAFVALLALTVASLAWLHFVVARMKRAEAADDMVSAPVSLPTAAEVVAVRS